MKHPAVCGGRRRLFASESWWPRFGSQPTLPRSDFRSQLAASIREAGGCRLFASESWGPRFGSQPTPPGLTQVSGLCYQTQVSGLRSQAQVQASGLELISVYDNFMPVFATSWANPRGSLSVTNKCGLILTSTCLLI